MSSPFFLQYNLICDRAYIAANVEAGFMAGMLVGSFAFGAVSDIFGRRPCMLLCSFLTVDLYFEFINLSYDNLGHRPGVHYRRKHAHKA